MNESYLLSIRILSYLSLLSNWINLIWIGAFSWSIVKDPGFFSFGNVNANINHPWQANTLDDLIAKMILIVSKMFMIYRPRSYSDKSKSFREVGSNVKSDSLVNRRTIPPMRSITILQLAIYSIIINDLITSMQAFLN